MVDDLLLAMEDAEFRKTMGLRIRALRKQRRWTLKELAAATGLRGYLLNKYECGVNAPPPQALVRLAEVLQTTTDHLLTGATTDTHPLRNVPLLERFRTLQDFPPRDIETVVTVLDAMIAKRKIEDVLKFERGRGAAKSAA